jgi:hypothetical protein
MWLYGPNSSSSPAPAPNYSDDAHGLWPRIEHTLSNPLQPGDYYIKAQEYYNDGTISAYTLSLTVTPTAQRVANPAFSPSPGTFMDSITVRMACETPGAAIRYTTDGSAPTLNSTVYDPSQPLNLTVTTRLSARAFKTGMTESEVVTGLYTKLERVATPTFNPPGGTFAQPVTVEIRCATPGATIRYTLDGAEPTSNSPAYVSPLNFTSTTTAKARAFKTGMSESSVASATYTITGPGGDIYEPDNTPSEAKAIANAETQRRSIHAAGNVDWVRFTLTQTSAVFIDTNGPSGDIQMWLYGPNSSTAPAPAPNYSDDAHGLWATIDHTAASPLEAGTYYIKLQEYGNNGIIPEYTLLLRTSAVAATYSVLGRVTRSSEGTGVSGVGVCFSRVSGNGTIPGCAMTDASGNWSQSGFGVGSSYRATPSKSEVGGTWSFTPQSRDFSGASTSVNFTAAWTSAIPLDAYEPDNSPSEAKVIRSGETQSRTIHAAGNVDWVKFTLTQASAVVIDANGPSGDLEMWLYGPNSPSSPAAAPNYSDDAHGLWPRIEHTLSNPLQPGDYYIKAQEYYNDGTISAYTLSLTVTPVSNVYEASGRVTNASGGAAVAAVTMEFARVSGNGSVPLPTTADANGTWRQTGFATGTGYQATPSKIESGGTWTFNPPNRAISGTDSGVNFTATWTAAPGLAVASVTPAATTRVLISARQRDGYPSPQQTEDRKIRITATLNRPAAGTPVYFLSTDPDDLSPYETAPQGDDNHDSSIRKGGLFPAAGYQDQPAQRVIEGSQIIGLAVLSDSQGRAQVDLTVTSRYAGDNYKVYAHTSPLQPTSPPGQGIPSTGLLVAWKRVYVEYDRMFRAGADVLSHSNTTVNGVNVTVLDVTDITPFQPGETVMVFDNANETGETAVVAGTSNTSGRNLLRLDRTLQGTYAASRKAAVVRPSAGRFGPESIEMLTNAYGGDTEGSDGGAFLEIRFPTRGAGSVPYRLGSSSAPSGSAGVIDYQNEYFSNQGRGHYLKVVAANQFYPADGVFGVTNVQQACLVFDGYLSTVKRGERVYGFDDVTAHELGHNLGGGGPGTLDSDSQASNPSHDKRDQCEQSYGRVRWNSIMEFCTPHLNLIRDFFIVF